jgi:hypothetical protein
MKKGLLLILVFFVSSHVNAVNYDANITGTTIKPPNTTTTGGDKKCPTGAYFLGNQSAGILGMRVTFYSTRGIQLGNTIDVWSDHFFKSSKTFVEAKESLKFTYYKTITNYTYEYPTRVDYINKGKNAFQLTGGEYHYYIDEVATKMKTNPLRAIVDGGSGSKGLKNYFTTPEVVDRYVQLARVNADNLISSGKYYILIEPITVAVACGSGRYGGVYTVSDFARLVSKNPYINNYTLRCNVPMGVRLADDFTLGNTTFTAVPSSRGKWCGYNKGNFTHENIFNDKIGVGMAIIIGTDVCKDNCKVPPKDDPEPEVDKKFKIVYHPINLANPFVYSKTGEVRKLNPNSNWYDKEDTIDTNIYSKAPFLTVTLNPADITKIREYNNKVGFKEFGCSNFKNSFLKIFSNTNFCK